MSNRHKVSTNSSTGMTRTCRWAKPPTSIQKAASALDLSYLKQGNEGQWQASDRYGNTYTITPRLVQSVLGKSNGAEGQAVAELKPSPLRRELPVAC